MTWIMAVLIACFPSSTRTRHNYEGEFDCKDRIHNEYHLLQGERRSLAEGSRQLWEAVVDNILVDRDPLDHHST